MSRPDFEKAKRIAQRRLANGLPVHLRYHSAAHTLEEVLPAVERLAEMENISGEDLLLLRTAGLYHDLGFTEQSEDHETIGARITEEVLPQLGYTPAQVKAIQNMILATKAPASPRTQLEEVIVDADLDILGRENYLERIRDLRIELKAQGTVVGDEEWYRHQLTFLETHAYWTASARALRDEGKQKNIRQLTEILENQEERTS